jgi:hypothetical protein
MGPRPRYKDLSAYNERAASRDEHSDASPAGESCRLPSTAFLRAQPPRYQVDLGHGLPNPVASSGYDPARQ